MTQVAWVLVIMARDRDKGQDINEPLPALEAAAATSAADAIIPWRLDRAEAGESCRWVCVDSRWVSVSLGEGADLGSVVVKSSLGQREVVESYEDALSLAKSWRTW